MKTKTKVWTALAAIFGVMCIVSCSDNDNGGDPEPGPDNGTTALVSKIESSDGNTAIKFEYDAQDRLSKMSWQSSEDNDNWDITYSWAANKVVVKYGDDPDITCSLGSDGTINSAIAHYESGTITENYKYGWNNQGPSVDYYECRYEDHDSWNQACRVKWYNGCVAKVYQVENETNNTQYSYTNIENKINVDLAEIIDEGTFQSELSSYIYPRSAGFGGVADKYLPSRIVDAWGDGKYTTTDVEYTLNDRGLPIAVIINSNDNGETERVTFKITYKQQF